MTQRQKRADLRRRITFRAWRWCGAIIALVLVIGAGAAVYAQVSSPAPPRFCYAANVFGSVTEQCFDSLDEAEQAMLKDPVNADVAAFLAPEKPDLPPHALAGRATYRYRVKDQPATLSQPSFYPVVSAIYDLRSCAKSSDVDPARRHWCTNEDELKTIIHRQIVNGHPACTVGQPVETSINRPPPYRKVSNVPNTNYGAVVYGNRKYTVSYDCNGTKGQTTIEIQMEAGFTCPADYNRLTDSTPNDGNNDRVLPVLCGYKWGRPAIAGSIQQVNACKGKRSDNPCYPATGDKARQEPDFEFAGTTFTRHYHAMHQFRNSPGSAIGWSHTYDDRITGNAGSAGPASLVDDTGAYESFVFVSAGRLQGENSTGKVLETFSSGTVRWRLRQPDGEQREYDVNGRLLKIVRPSDPRQDVTLGYANDLLATATDGQGRVLRFQYDAARLLKSIRLPDDSSVH